MPEFKKFFRVRLGLGAVIIACQTSQFCQAQPVKTQAPENPPFKEIFQKGFRSQGIASIDRLTQDANQIFCSDPRRAQSAAGMKEARMIEQRNLESIKAPTDGVYLGDWRNGEKIAQSGRGLTWSDVLETPVGGGCYNCHQIDEHEIAYGNLGPSLWHYGKNRGSSKEVLIYTWNHISNAKAYNACSQMPRFAHSRILTEKQIQDLMALLFDPNSAVNQ